MEYKVLITASGVGGRLGDLTKYTNKSLVRVGKKPVISYIVEAYPVDTKYVVTLGYFAEQVREFLTLAYPERHFEFVEVDTFDGPGSSLGYSMLSAKDALQCPFIFHASDTIVTAPIPAPDRNWIGVSTEGDTAHYASWKLVGGTQLIFNAKGAIDYDCIHIGLVGVRDYVQFWRSLAALYAENPRDPALNDCRAIERMLADGATFATHAYADWYDTGSAQALKQARARIYDHFENLDKLEESIFFFKDFVIKFFYDEKVNTERVARGNALGALVPPLEGTAKHFYRYRYAEGENYADVATPVDFQRFLGWTKERLWHPVPEVDRASFKEVCRDFYHVKTKKRVEKFLAQNTLHDQTHVINGETVPSIAAMLEMVDFDWLSDAAPYQFHGDFILENIIKTKDGYCLIDWRQNFGGLLNAGDIYYDLAKLNHNLTVNHDMINKDHYSVAIAEDGSVSCDIFRRNNLVECQEVLWKFVTQEGFDLKRVRLLSAIIWLNMAPLHHHPFDQFLYYFGKLHLWRALQDIQKQSGIIDKLN